MFHLTSGDCAAELLRRSGLPGTVVGWRDSAAVGPSPGGLSFAEYRAVRAAFRGVSAEGFQDVDLLATLPAGEEVVLWFDACPYDQLILVRLLNEFGLLGRDLGSLHLVEVGEFPGIEPFHSLGQLTPEQLAALFPARRPVGAVHLSLAAAAWRAHGASDPREIERLVLEPEEGGDEALPYLRPALRRLLEELPATGDGLGRTERACLEAVAAGERSFSEIFRAVTRLEKLNHGGWYGDGELRKVLENLAALPAPALARFGDLSFELAGIGRALLAGEADWVESHEIDRWQGGVHLRGWDVWSWDRRAGRLVRPAQDPF